ncbi:MAG: HU family DNA-binding protein [Candidatus Eremiobacteraeota bacterium]|nr:HU family DNA-binding protein [Candidatus Eremiobacteraeota bacterium]
MSVTRRDLAKALKDRHGGTITDHDSWIQDFVQILSEKISEEGRVSIRGFGTFNLNTIKAHTTINPGIEVPEGKKPKRIKVPETYTVDFTTAKSYKERLKAAQKKAKAKKKRKKKATTKKKRSKAKK